MHIIVGMSGGVDSSVTAALLREEGHRVEGVSLQLWERRGSCAPEVACCSLESAAMAARVADIIGIPHAVVDARGPFMDRVIAPFADAYHRGRTPNPCILCNEAVKFPLLLAAARERGADGIATGHYARVRREGGETPTLLRGKDPKKDQSYFLYSIGTTTLEQLHLPLGDLRKTRVREIAAELGFPVADRPESQEICFVGEEGYGGFLRELAPESLRPGPIVDREGTVIGTHTGVVNFTVGQRKGLGIPSPEPHYVLRIDAATNSVVIGRREDAQRKDFGVTELRWLVAAPRVGEHFDAEVRIRSMTPPRPGRVTVTGNNEAEVQTEDALWAPAPGQAAVFYDGDRVLGGGEIR